MKKLLLACIAVSAAVSTLVAAEIPPYNPAPAPAMPQGTAIAAGEVKFTLPDGVTIAPGEFNRVRSLNCTWLCSGLETSATAFPADVDRDKGYEKPDFDDSKWDKIEVPLNWYKKYDYTKYYDKNRPYVKGYYRHEIEIPAADIENHSVLLHFGVIGYEATLWVNGQEVGSHHGDFVPWTVDIIRFVKPGKNLLALKVLSDFGPAFSNIKLGTHSYGSQWSVPNIKGGLWQDVELRIEAPVRVEQMLVTPQLADNSVRLDYRIVNNTGKAIRCQLGAAVTGALKTSANQLNAATEAKPIELAPGVNSGNITVKLKDPVRWELDNPYLYYATLYLTRDGKVTSAKSERFGFREFRIKDGKFHLNGRRLYLFGENLSSVKFGGHGDTEKNLAFLREKLSGFKSLGYNIIRNSHMPAIKEVYEIADEIGLMIYNEWGWSFTNFIDEAEFARRNPVEFQEWLIRDYNHPSVVMWSCGNEVVHRGNPAVQRELDRQVDLVHAVDKSGRPAGSFSGSGTWTSYGTDPRNTDFLDLHNYVGNGSSPWTTWPQSFEMLYSGSLEHYKAPGKQLPMPYIIWECIGFSWGGTTDRNFKQNDIKAYAKYVESPTTWALPNGIGYAGTIGLARALQPGSLDYGQEIYGRRLLELIRQDPRIDGFAPWFHGYQLKAATLWNQPVLVGLRKADLLPPVSLFSGDTRNLELYIANSRDTALRNAVAKIRLQTAPDRSVDIGEFKAADVAPFEVTGVPVALAIPDGISGHCQLRIDLSADGKEISRNFYNVFVQPKSLLTKKIDTAKKVALLDVGSRADVETTGAILKSLGINFEVIDGKTAPTNFDLAIIPASLENQRRLAVDTTALLSYLRNGGKLLILEQNYGNGSLLNDVNVLSTGNTFIDLIFPEHPVFKGLDQRNFDTWENPKNGYVCEGALSPFTLNAIAVKGPMLGKRNVETAILEATIGKGQLFWSQLAAVNQWGKDSSASTYLINVLDYLLNGKCYGKVLPLALNSDSRYPLVEKNLVQVDLSKFTNRSFSDEKDNDGKSGWTDQGSNDFRKMPLGRQTAAGVPFNVIDPTKNGGTSCIVLSGVERPNFPDAVRGIPVNAKFSRIFFLHTAAWDGPEAGRYRFHYADGSTADYVLIPGDNIGDWWNCSYLPNAKTGLLAPNPTRDQVGTYVACWENPHPEKEIKSFDFLSARCQDAGSINFDPSKAPVPVLVAVTGEKYNPEPLPIDTTAVPGSWIKGGSTGKDGKPAVMSRVETVLPDGTKGEAVQLDFPASGPGETAPYIFVKFAPEKFDPAKVNYLSFLVKAPKSGTLDLSLPAEDWKAAYRVTTDVGGSENWQKIRIPLSTINGAEQMAGKQLRGEFFLYNGNNRAIAFPRQPVTLLIADIMLE